MSLLDTVEKGRAVYLERKGIVYNPKTKSVTLRFLEDPDRGGIAAGTLTFYDVTEYREIYNGDEEEAEGFETGGDCDNLLGIIEPCDNHQRFYLITTTGIELYITTATGPNWCEPAG